ncbi:MAG: NAC family transcription factor [Methanoregulaceae archaeon]|nr:NAC family transcription factor [Methanoregulaceae archaeon]
MEGDDKDGNYCSVCGGIPPDKIKIRQILIDGRETGIDQLDFIIRDVKNLHLTEDALICQELMKRVKVFNYVPTKKTAQYEEALLKEYKNAGD